MLATRQPHTYKHQFALTLEYKAIVMRSTLSNLLSASGQ